MGGGRRPLECFASHRRSQENSIVYDHEYIESLKRMNVLAVMFKMYIQREGAID